MKKVINIEAGEVFTLLTTGKDVYCVLTDDDQLFNLKYEPVGFILDKLKKEDCTLFIVEEETEA